MRCFPGVRGGTAVLRGRQWLSQGVYPALRPPTAISPNPTPSRWPPLGWQHTCKTEKGEREGQMELCVKSAKQEPPVEKMEQGQERPGEAPGGCQAASLSGRAGRPAPSPACPSSTDEWAVPVLSQVSLGYVRAVYDRKGHPPPQATLPACFSFCWPQEPQFCCQTFPRNKPRLAKTLHTASLL